YGEPARGGDRGSVAGRLILHPDGYGFVVPDQPIAGMDGDVFIPRDGIGDSMHGDHVAVQLIRTPGRVSEAGQRIEGRIVKVLERKHPTVVGLFRYTARGAVVLPYDTRIQHEVELALGDELSTGVRKRLGLPEAEPGRKRPLGRVRELDGAVVN